MTMPMMPGLTGAEEETEDMGGGGGEDGGIASLLEQVDDETMVSLIAEADEAYLNGELDEYMAAPPAESDPEAVETEEGGGEDSAGEAGETEEGAEAPTTVDPMVAEDNAAAIVEEIAAQESEVGDLLAMAEDSDEGDPKPIKEALDVVVEAMAEAEEAKEKVVKAAKDEDLEALSEAIGEAEGAAAKAKEAVASAKEAAKTQVTEAHAEEEVSPLAAWAEANS
jgi:hypothetical protein